MNVGLLGFGVVGGGVYEWCRNRSDICINRVLVRSDKPEIADIATREFSDILNDPANDTVAECMGGLHPAYEYVSAALKAGKNVVTANKALIAAYYQELIALAKEHGAALRCTAAVGGGIPWLTNLERCKRLDRICELGGIMNGTTNYIMDAMHRSQVEFDDVLKKAQALGYAEADPSADIDGDDIRRKLVISANIAFDAALPEEEIPTFGIRYVTKLDIQLFQKHSFVCKMLAMAEPTEKGICAFIEPTLVESNAPEAAVPANFNLISYCGENIGRQSFFGQGAGRFPTAANVVQDCMDILQGQKSFYAEKATPVPLDCVESHPYYVRCDTPDPWLKEKIAEEWAPGCYITGAVVCGEMIAWAKAHPGCFIAGIR